MGVRTKTLVTVVLVGAVVGVFALSTSNTQLFKGQIFNQNENPETAPTIEEGNLPLPDLNAEIATVLPATEGGDLVVEATISNVGEGSITGGTPFVYSIYINETEVFSNSDSYSELAPGDEFSFKYPISRSIYSYPNEGTVKLIIDTENSIKEADESNNEIVKKYKL